jgi:hypothetical protein
MADALTIAQNLGLRVFRLLSDVLVSQDVSAYRFESVTGGQGMILLPGAVTKNTFMLQGYVSGVMNGAMFVKESGIITGTTGLEGTFLDCILVGSLELKASCTFMHCMSGVAGFNPAVISMAGADAIATPVPVSLELRNYTGGIMITDSTQEHQISIDLDPGVLHIDASNTAGTLKLRGVGEPVNDMGASFTAIDDDGFLVASDTTKLRKVMMNRLHTDPNTGVMTIYDDDDATVAFSGNIYEDIPGTQPYRGRGSERRNKLA